MGAEAVLHAVPTVESLDDLEVLVDDAVTGEDKHRQVEAFMALSSYQPHVSDDERPRFAALANRLKEAFER